MISLLQTPLNSGVTQELAKSVTVIYIVLNNYNFGQAMKTCLDELMPVTVNGGSTFKKSLTDQGPLSLSKSQIEVCWVYRGGN